jgi:pyridoxal phosphate enzyme (YggS family)
VTDPAVVAANLDAVRDRIRAAGGDVTAVTIVAVTKGFGPDAVDAAVAAGATDLGENYAAELVDKWRPGVRWHFLGAVQRNKVASLAPLVDLWQGVDRAEEAAAIAVRAPEASVLVQVNVSGEAQKSGCAWDDVATLVERARAGGVEVRGLMAVGPTGPPEDARLPFRRLAATARALELPEVSMGMTADLEVAVQEGATMVRVGTALFGARPRSGPGRR